MRIILNGRRIRRFLKWSLCASCLVTMAIVLLSEDLDDAHRPTPSPTSVTKSSPRTARHTTAIGFLKVHKAASTTLQFILVRFGLARNLTFVLPRRKSPPGYSHVLSQTGPVSQADIDPAPGRRPYNLLCHHTVYSQDAWAQLLGPGARTIGVVRHPVEHFRSVLRYFKPEHIRRIVSTSKVADFLQQPMEYEVSVLSSSTNNMMSFEFGVDPSVIMTHDMDAFKNYLDEVLDTRFDLVIVTERFDQSLVLMRRQLNWNLTDVLYIRKNTYTENHPEWTMGDDLIPLLKEHNAMDFMLYDHFSKRLQRQISSELGHGFNDEVKMLRSLRATVIDFCTNVMSGVNSAGSVVLEESPWNARTSWTKADCELFLMSEIKMTELLRQKQNAR